jgi:hypothetical protein
MRLTFLKLIPVRLLEAARRLLPGIHLKNIDFSARFGPIA